MRCGLHASHMQGRLFQGIITQLQVRLPPLLQKYFFLPRVGGALANGVQTMKDEPRWFAPHPGAGSWPEALALHRNPLPAAPAAAAGSASRHCAQPRL